jgi:flagellar assembly factor FliW
LTFLQSTRQSGLCFLALPILMIDPQYALTVSAEDLAALEFDENRQPAIGGDVDCLAMIAAPEQGPPTANLLAPIVIHRGKRVGLQAIRIDAIYSHQHLLGPEEDVCS